MRWETLTAMEFEKAVRKTGVCVIAMGVIERHGEHLPLGTDYLNGHRIACLAAEKEPAVVFPPFYFGQIYEARCFPGTITVKPTLLLDLIQSVFDEIGRNGFRKIVVYSAHGGNSYLLPFLAQCSLWEQKPYSVYLMSDRLSPERQKRWNAILQTAEHGHACECESSITMANFPEMVRADRIPPQPARALGRARKLGAAFTGIRWYSNYPEHYAGDARAASPEKGRQLRQLIVDSLAEFIRAVKRDEVVPALEREFFRRALRVSSGQRLRRPR